MGKEGSVEAGSCVGALTEAVDGEGDPELRVADDVAVIRQNSQEIKSAMARELVSMGLSLEVVEKLLNLKGDGHV
jgi:hypothetical protein